MNTAETGRAPVLMRDTDDDVVDALPATLPSPVTDDPKDTVCRANAAAWSEPIDLVHWRETVGRTPHWGPEDTAAVTQGEAPVAAFDRADADPLVASASCSEILSGAFVNETSMRRDDAAPATDDALDRLGRRSDSYLWMRQRPPFAQIETPVRCGRVSNDASDDAEQGMAYRFPRHYSKNAKLRRS